VVVLREALPLLLNFFIYLFSKLHMAIFHFINLHNFVPKLIRISERVFVFFQHSALLGIVKVTISGRQQQQQQQRGLSRTATHAQLPYN
jgi:hypothetical protein